MALYYHSCKSVRREIRNFNKPNNMTNNMTNSTIKKLLSILGLITSSNRDAGYNEVCSELFPESRVIYRFEKEAPFLGYINKDTTFTSRPPLAFGPYNIPRVSEIRSTGNALPDLNCQAAIDGPQVVDDLVKIVVKSINELAGDFNKNLFVPGRTITIPEWLNGKAPKEARLRPPDGWTPPAYLFDSKEEEEELEEEEEEEEEVVLAPVYDQTSNNSVIEAILDAKRRHNIFTNVAGSKNLWNPLVILSQKTQDMFDAIPDSHRTTEEYKIDTDFIVNEHCPDNKAYLLDRKTWTFRSLAETPHFSLFDGGHTIITRPQLEDGSVGTPMLRVLYRGNLLCHDIKRNATVLLPE